MRVIVDSNVWISFLLGFQKEMMQSMLSNEHIEIFACPQLLAEIRDVTNRPKIRSRVEERDIEQLFSIIRLYCTIATISQRATADIRDSKDLYLLSLSESIHADYIISGDNDLLSLCEHKKARIVSPAQFRMIQ